jgi:hypothetical protein
VDWWIGGLVDWGLEIGDWRLRILIGDWRIVDGVLNRESSTQKTEQSRQSSPGNHHRAIVSDRHSVRLAIVRSPFVKSPIE